jgi:hypothetical protein
LQEHLQTGSVFGTKIRIKEKSKKDSVPKNRDRREKDTKTNKNIKKDEEKSQTLGS